MPIVPATAPQLQTAAELLRRGELVAFPTETVYGLGANALNPDAVAKIYQRKGRPSFNPLIVHVASIEAARELVTEWSDLAQQLAEAFWPGPLTLVLPKQSVIPGIVSAGLDTVALRIPSHPIAHELLQTAQIPLAAPSANRSNAISPTLARHVADSLGENLFILDGGLCEVGIESTVLDLTKSTPAILRPGMVSAQQLEPFCGLLASATQLKDADEAPRASPGMMERHYAPRAKVYLYPNLTDAHYHAVLLSSGQKVGVLSLNPTDLNACEIVMPSTPQLYAQRLYAALHELDEAGVGLILIEQVPEGSEWNGVRDRISRAAKS